MGLYPCGADIGFRPCRYRDVDEGDLLPLQIEYAGRWGEFEAPLMGNHGMRVLARDFDVGRPGQGSLWPLGSARLAPEAKADDGSQCNRVQEKFVAHFHHSYQCCQLIRPDFGLKMGSNSMSRTWPVLCWRNTVSSSLPWWIAGLEERPRPKSMESATGSLPPV